jgi:D-alanyl-D-alanine carboxypeptidase
MTSTACSRRAVFCAVAAGAVAVPGAAAANAPRHHAVRPPTAASARLTVELRGLVRMPDGPPGAIVIVQRAGQRRVYTAGVPVLGSQRSIRVSDRMRLASTAKAFSGAVALSLVAAHKLSLNDTVAELLPKLNPAWGKVTLRQALNHTSGLPDLLGNEALRAYVGKHRLGSPTPMFLMHFLRHDPLEFRPGSRYAYSNTDNFVVGLMAQAVTHRGYAALLRSRVYRPLRLRGTSLPRGVAIPAPFMHGYQPDPPGPPADVTHDLSAAYSWASGGLVSTPADLNRFIRGYAGARLFGRAVQKRQLRFVAGNSEPIGPGTNSAGLGIFRYRTRCGTVYGHTGNIPGYTQFMASTLDGRRSVTASVTGQITNKMTGARLTAFKELRRIETDAVCSALSGR